MLPITRTLHCWDHCVRRICSGCHAWFLLVSCLHSHICNPISCRPFRRQFLGPRSLNPSGRSDRKEKEGKSVLCFVDILSKAVNMRNLVHLRDSSSSTTTIDRGKYLGKYQVGGQTLVNMRPAILILHPHLRASFPRALQKDLSSRLFARLKTTTPRNPRGIKEENLGSKAKDAGSSGSRIPTSSPAGHAKTSIRRGMMPKPASLVETEVPRANLVVLQDHRSVY